MIDNIKFNRCSKNIEYLNAHFFYSHFKFKNRKKFDLLTVIIYT